MPLVVANTFKSWLKANNNIKLSSEAVVTRIIYEGITNYHSLEDFDKKLIERLPATCKVTILAITEDLGAGISAKPEILGASVFSISVRHLVVASNAVKYYISIGRAMNVHNMQYSNVLSEL